ncbi:hypothetical protein WJX75_009384 [Coccomyxa subellipsoidea]|uniref:Uncharacterized protein n=1 Tax=Coccomyxa subellipsoidea TaxID=248742 RepID=A0ABR2YCK5_9CHLO
MEITKVAAVLWLLCTVPLLAEIVPLHSNSAHYIDTENKIPNKGFDDYEANAFTPEEGVAPAPAAAQGPKPPPATARKMNRKLQQSNLDTSASALATIFSFFDNAPPGLIPADMIAPEEEEAISAAALAPAAAPKPAAAPNLAPPAATKSAAAPKPAAAPNLAPPAATKSAAAPKKTAEGFKDIFTPAELQAMFGAPEEEGDSAKAAAAGRRAPAAPKARGRQLLQPMSLEEQLVWRAVKKSLVDTEAEQAQAEFDQVIEEIAAAVPGPAGADSASRRRMLQDYNSPDFPRKIFDLAFQLAPNHGPVRPEAAGAPEYHLVPEAIPTRGLLQDDQSNYSALEDIVSLPDTVLPVAVEVKGPEAESAPALAPVPAGKALTGKPAPSVH